MIHYNELKISSRSLFDTFKKVMDYSTAIDSAINATLAPFTLEQILTPGRVFSTMDDLRSQIKHELEEEINLFVDDGTHFTLSDPSGHIDWYRQKKAAGEIPMRFWTRYKKYLTHEKTWATSSVDNLDSITDEIIEKLEDPTVKNREFDRRALVVGYVQSGKTANFMGLINKAIDSGYRVIIVLAGMHENLRQQTQERIDEEIIGRDTSKKAEIKKIGVAAMPGETYIPIDNLTESNFNPKGNGDFNIKRSHGTPPTTDRPIIFIVKKNKSILNNLIKYFRDWIETFDETLTYKRDGIKQFNNLPLLLIDDEADQASVNTKALETKEGEETNPTAINYCIRELLQLFRQKVYLAYTATPFANIFIHHDHPHSILGRDLFPLSFIISLDAPSNYLGPRRTFGLNDSEEQGLPIFRSVIDAGTEHSEFMPLKHKSDYVPVEFPESLRNAIKAFAISSALRWLRGQERKHNTMLIHCTRFNLTQTRLASLVDDYLQILRSSIINSDVGMLHDLRKMYENDFIPTSTSMNVESLPEWNQLMPFLIKAIKKIEEHPLVINGTVGDILDYKNKKDTGLSVIAIGGDKLSRGLTLEGLTISYFTRSTSMYDTLMQMGRWFGYRGGFEDLCRIYTTPDLFSWYRHISTAFEILRTEFIEMARLKLTPRHFGLRVLSHPDMMITNIMKMRQAEPMRLDYQGTLTETSTLPNDAVILNTNFDASENFIRSLGTPSINQTGKIVWLDKGYESVQGFLKDYKTYKGLPAANSIRISQYIDLQVSKEIPECTLWDIALVTLIKSGNKNFSGHKIAQPTRSLTKPERDDSLFIQRMHDPRFEFLDFSDTEMKYIKDNKISNREARRFSPRNKKPLLMIYVLNIENRTFEKDPVAFAISWPSSATTVALDYYINTVYQELEFSQYD